MPTPVADGDRTTNYKQGGTSLGYAARSELFPTPSATKVWPNTMNTDDLVDHEGNPWELGRKPYDRRTGRPVTTALADVAHHYPTPATSQLHKPVRPLAPSEAKGTHGTMLVGAVGDRHPESIGGTLNPSWVCWMMGIPLGWDSLEPLAEGAYEEWLEHMTAGTWWAEERGLPRTTTGVENRVKRLMMLGNGVVPASGALAFITLEGEA